MSDATEEAKKERKSRNNKIYYARHRERLIKLNIELNDRKKDDDDYKEKRKIWNRTSYLRRKGKEQQRNSIQ